MDIDAGDELVERIKPWAAMTRRPEILSGVGGFGGLFAIPSGKFKEPVLVSGTDGVGTKLKVALLLDRHDTVGIDLVAMSVNDVVTSGAEPLFFLDYFATSKLDVPRAEQVIAGIARGCQQAGCALIGGETAEMPGFYAPGEYDLAGFCVGIVERDKILDGRTIQPGDAIVGLASTGLHSNGYSLARRVLVDNRPGTLDYTPSGFETTVSDALLAPTRIYAQEALELISAVEVKGLAHITGGGLPGNLPRCLPRDTRAVLDETSWKRPPIFDLIAEMGNVERDEMYRTFNMGVGMIAVMPSAHVPAAIRLMKKQNLTAWEIGRIEKGEGEPVVTIEG